MIAELAAEVARRQQAGGRPAECLSICSSTTWPASATCARKTMFSSARRRQAGQPGKLFAAILRDGPSCGVHTIAWADTYATVNRLLDRASLRDFDLRVLFQMNASDSSSLMESPDAARLGVHRAIFYDGGHGQMEKFRPYGLPSAKWLAEVQRQLFRRCEAKTS